MTAAAAGWTVTEMELPPDGEVVEVLNGDQVQTLVRKGQLWWFPDFSMYVYFVPKMWRHRA